MSRTLAVIVVLVAAVSCNSSIGPSLGERFPCEQKTSVDNSSLTVRVRNAANKVLSGARVTLDPYGQEKISNVAGAVCFGNLRVPATGCILTNITVSKDGYGTAREIAFVLSHESGNEVAIQLQSKPVTHARPAPSGCATSP